MRKRRNDWQEGQCPLETETSRVRVRLALVVAIIFIVLMGFSILLGSFSISAEADTSKRRTRLLPSCRNFENCGSRIVQDVSYFFRKIAYSFSTIFDCNILEFFTFINLQFRNF